jgi:hypothetical protein
VAGAYNPAEDEFLAVWSQDDGRGPDLFTKPLGANGLPKGGPAKAGSLLVRSGSSKPAAAHDPRVSPAIVYNPDEQEYLVVWSQQHGEPAGFDLVGLRVSSRGFAAGEPRVLVGLPGDQGHPAVAYRADPPSYLLVYDDNSRDIDEVWAVRVRPNGVPVGSPFLLVRGPANAHDPAVAVRTDGFLVAWVDDRNANSDIYARWVNENGLPIGGSQGQVYPLRMSPEDEIAPALDPSSGQLVYTVFDPATGMDVLGVQLYGNGGTRGGRTIGIVVPVADQADPAVALNVGRSESVIVFSDNRSGQLDLYAVRVRNNLPRGADYPVLADGFLP